ncbi:RteC domain-containing protein, partial [uncultured Mucilaginibacter sp.]|uniref:RteC domain-containing protein n=2 Tax=uncultured Mucilaginibacter sp. TaxID=797541 RepID=UPI0025D390DC
ILKNGITRLQELRQDVEEFNDMGIPPAQQVRGKLNSVRNALNDLTLQLDSHLFKDDDEEIAFFKTVKPQFKAIYIYETEIFKIETGRPVGEQDAIFGYYEQELKYIRNFFAKHQFLYQYYLHEGTELDKAYFTLGGQITQPIIDQPLDISRDTTIGDYFFSRFIANEQIQEYLLRAIYLPEVKNHLQDRPEVSIKWTGDKANLIELAYGIWLTGQLNEGNASLNEIIRWLENVLAVKLGNFRKRFSELESRKRLSSTKFIDQMKAVILKKMEDDLA